jgi:hypothetical protein
LTSLIANESLTLSDTVKDASNKSFFIAGSMQVFEVIASQPKALNAVNIATMQ